MRIEEPGQSGEGVLCMTPNEAKALLRFFSPELFTVTTPEDLNKVAVTIGRLKRSLKDWLKDEEKSKVR